MKHIEKIEKEFDEKFVNEDFFTVYYKGKTSGNYFDENNLKSFLRQSHTSFIQDLIQRVEGERKPTDLDDFDIRTKTLCVGFNLALDTIIKMLKEEI
jgi:uncharacterized protein (UPF0335 family)